jgi:hypothetical protein
MKYQISGTHDSEYEGSLCSGLLRRVAWYEYADVSEVLVTSIMMAMIMNMPEAGSGSRLFSKVLAKSRAGGGGGLETSVVQYTVKPRYMRFRSMRVSVNTVTNICTIPIYVSPKISNSAADYETKRF